MLEFESVTKPTVVCGDARRLMDTGPNAEGPAPRPHWLQVVLIGRNPKRTLVRIVILTVVCLLVFNRYVLLPIFVEGGSMLPTYREHGVNFINRLAYLSHGPQRGDVVGIRYTGYHIMLLKRIIGLPGETVAFHRGRVFIDGKQLDEPYVKFSCDWELPPRTLGTNEYYFVGDNRSMRAGEQTFGVGDRSRIMGRILL
jgi:signal peptidase I